MWLKVGIGIVSINLQQIDQKHIKQTSGNIVVRWFSQSLRVGNSPGRHGSFPAKKSWKTTRVFVQKLIAWDTMSWSRLTYRGRKTFNINRTMDQREWLYKKPSIKRLLRIDENPEWHPSTINILLFAINKIHWNIKGVINILLKPVSKEKRKKQSRVRDNVWL